MSPSSWKLLLLGALLATASGCGSGAAGTDAGADAAGNALIDMTGVISDLPSAPEAATPQDLAVALDAAIPDDLGTAQISIYQTMENGDLTVITINHTTRNVTILDTTQNFQLAGPYVAVPSGFLKLTIDFGCDGPNCVPGQGGAKELPIGTTVHILEALNQFVVLEADGKTGPPFVAVLQNDCANGMFGSYNSIEAFLPSNYDVTKNPAYSIATLGGNAGAVTVTGSNFTIDGTNLGMFPNLTAACAHGVTSVTNTVNFLSSANGVGLANENTPGSPSALGFVTSAIALADIENQTYTAIKYEPDSNMSEAVALVFGGNPTGFAKGFIDVDNNVVDANQNNWLSVTLTGVVGGLVTGTIGGNPPSPFKAAALKSGNRVFLSMIVGANRGKSDGGLAEHAVSVVMLSQ